MNSIPHRPCCASRLVQLCGQVEIDFTRLLSIRDLYVLFMSGDVGLIHAVTNNTRSISVDTMELFPAVNSPALTDIHMRRKIRQRVKTRGIGSFLCLFTKLQVLDIIFSDIVHLEVEWNHLFIHLSRLKELNVIFTGYYLDDWQKFNYSLTMLCYDRNDNDGVSTSTVGRLGSTEFDRKLIKQSKMFNENFFGNWIQIVKYYPSLFICDKNVPETVDGHLDRIEAINKFYERSSSFVNNLEVLTVHFDVSFSSSQFDTNASPTPTSAEIICMDEYDTLLPIAACSILKEVDDAFTLRGKSFDSDDDEGDDDESSSLNGDAVVVRTETSAYLECFELGLFDLDANLKAFKRLHSVAAVGISLHPLSLPRNQLDRLAYVMDDDTDDERRNLINSDDLMDYSDHLTQAWASFLDDSMSTLSHIQISAIEKAAKLRNLNVSSSQISSDSSSSYSPLGYNLTVLSLHYTTFDALLFPLDTLLSLTTLSVSKFLIDDDQKCFASLPSSLENLGASQFVHSRLLTTLKFPSSITTLTTNVAFHVLSFNLPPNLKIFNVDSIVFSAMLGSAKASKSEHAIGHYDGISITYFPRFDILMRFFSSLPKSLEQLNIAKNYSITDTACSNRQDNENADIHDGVLYDELSVFPYGMVPPDGYFQRSHFPPNLKNHHKAFFGFESCSNVPEWFTSCHVLPSEKFDASLLSQELKHLHVGDPDRFSGRRSCVNFDAHRFKFSHLNNLESLAFKIYPPYSSTTSSLSPGLRDVGPRDIMEICIDDIIGKKLTSLVMKIGTSAHDNLYDDPLHCDFYSPIGQINCLTGDWTLFRNLSNIELLGVTVSAKLWTNLGPTILKLSLVNCLLADFDHNHLTQEESKAINNIGKTALPLPHPYGGDDRIVASSSSFGSSTIFHFHSVLCSDQTFVSINWILHLNSKVKLVHWYWPYRHPLKKSSIEEVALLMRFSFVQDISKSRRFIADRSLIFSFVRANHHQHHRIHPSSGVIRIPVIGDKFVDNDHSEYRAFWNFIDDNRLVITTEDKNLQPSTSSSKGQHYFYDPRGEYMKGIPDATDSVGSKKIVGTYYSSPDDDFIRAPPTRIVISIYDCDVVARCEYYDSETRDWMPLSCHRISPMLD